MKQSHIDKLRRIMRRKAAQSAGTDVPDEIEEEFEDDVSVMSKWNHNTNIEASDEFLERLKKYHPDMDHD